MSKTRPRPKAKPAAPVRDAILLQAIDKLGGPTEMATRIMAIPGAEPITQSAISQWRKVPIKRVNEVAAVSGIPREHLRSDIFGPPSVKSDVRRSNGRSQPTLRGNP